jgi:hypothetical protein
MVSSRRVLFRSRARAVILILPRSRPPEEQISSSSIACGKGDALFQNLVVEEEP